MEHTAPQWGKQRRRRGYEDGSKQSFVLEEYVLRVPGLGKFLVTRAQSIQEALVLRDQTKTEGMNHR